METGTLRKATAADVRTVQGFYRSVIGRPGCTWNESYPVAEDIQADLQASCLYVYEQAGNVIGAVSVVPERELDDLTCWQVQDGTHREIARVVISCQQQGKGYARFMLAELFAQLTEQGCHAIHLLVAVDNPAATHTYQALGFQFLEQCTRYGHQYHVCEKLLTKT